MTLIIIAAFTKKSFPFWGGAFWEPLVSNTYIPLFKVYFHHTGCPKEWKMQWNWLKFEIYDLIQSIFWDTLYGENTLKISISMYLGLKASQCFDRKSSLNFDPDCGIFVQKLDIFWQCSSEKMKLCGNYYVNFKPKSFK